MAVQEIDTSTAASYKTAQQDLIERLYSLRNSGTIPKDTPLDELCFSGDSDFHIMMRDVVGVDWSKLKPIVEKCDDYELRTSYQRAHSLLLQELKERRGRKGPLDTRFETHVVDGVPINFKIVTV